MLFVYVCRRLKRRDQHRYLRKVKSFGVRTMDEPAFIGEDVEGVEPTSASGAAVSWSAAIAGALAATAVTFVVVLLGAGIQLAVASPNAVSPIAGPTTIGDAVWLVLAQTLGFAVGGFTAGRLRLKLGTVPSAETRFRDGANGFMVWAVGAVAVAGVLAVGGALAIANAVWTGEALVSQTRLGYLVDSLTRVPQPGQGAGGIDADHGRIVRVLENAVRERHLQAGDRTYLATLVAAKTGVSQDEAERRVEDTFNRTQDGIRQVADTTRKTGAHVALLTFVSMLLGAVAATLGGILGGELRDESSFRLTQVNSSRRRVP
jgi:hypothetical protein